MNIFSFRSVLAVMLACGFSSSVWAADRCGGEIHFDKGKTATTLTGKVAGYDFCSYTFYAKKGQELIVNSNKNDRPQAILFDYEVLDNNQPFILPKSGKYELRVGMSRTDARKFPNKAQPFTIKFSITEPLETDSQVVAAASSGFVGDYAGILPCASCKGIDTYLVLYNNGSYTLSEMYLGRSSDSVVRQGRWMVYGDAVILEPEDSKADSLYLFAHNGDMYFVSQKEAGAAKPQLDEQYRLKHQQ